MKKYLKITMLLILASMFFTACDKKIPQTIQKKTEDATNIKGSIMDLLNMGKNVKCTYSGEQDGVYMDMETYISGNKVRTTMTQDGTDMGKVVFNTVMDETWMYTWDSMGNAYKMNLEEMKKMGEEFQEQYGTGDASDLSARGKIQNQEQFDYKCIPWIPNNSKFEVPSDIEFVDQGQFMEEALQQTQEMKESLKDMCSMCDTMPDEQSKIECRQNLGCD